MYRATPENVTTYDEEKKDPHLRKQFLKSWLVAISPHYILVSAFAQMESSFYYTCNTKDPFIVAPYKC